MSKSIGELSVVIGAKVDEFKRGMAEVSAGIENANRQIKAADRDWKRSFGAITKEVRNFGLAMGAAGVAIVGGLFKAVQTTGKLGEEFLNLKAKTGMTVETLSELKYMADTTGSSLETIEVAVKAMNNAIDSAMQGTIKLTKDETQAMQDLADKIAEIKRNASEDIKAIEAGKGKDILRMTQDVNLRIKRLMEDANARAGADAENGATILAEAAKDALRIRQDLATDVKRLEQDTSERVRDVRKTLADDVSKAGKGEVQSSVASAEAFKRIGLSVETLAQMKPDDKFWAIAEALAAVKDDGERSALAIDIFGRSGTDLLPILDAGKNGIQAMKDKAKELGVVMSEETAQKAAAFNKSMEDMAKAVEGIAGTVAEIMTPAFKDVVKWITDLLVQVKDWIKENPKLVEAFKNVGIVLAVGGTLLVGLTYAATMFLKLNTAWTVAKGLLPGLNALLGTSATTGLAGALGYVGLAIAGIAGWAIAIKSIVDNFEDWSKLIQQGPWKTLFTLLSKGQLLDLGEGITLTPGTKEKADIAREKLKNPLTPSPAPTPTPSPAPAPGGGTSVPGEESLEDFLRRINGDATARKILIDNGLVPSFAQGGIVPGPIGAPVPVIAHGGEAFAGVGKTFGDTIINISLGLLPGDEVTMGRFISMIKSKLGRDSRRNSFGPVNQGYFFGRSST
jgi:hypothetical protein